MASELCAVLLQHEDRLLLLAIVECPARSRPSASEALRRRRKSQRRKKEAQTSQIRNDRFPNAARIRPKFHLVFSNREAHLRPVAEISNISTQTCASSYGGQNCIRLQLFRTTDSKTSLRLSSRRPA
jgi:hypothetical protein